MACRKNKITLLKEKLCTMQNELTILTKKEKEVPLSPVFRSIELSPSRRTSQNREYKSPTFWGDNPITHQSKYSPARNQLKLTPTRQAKRESLNHSLSPKMKDIINTIDSSFYNRSTDEFNKTFAHNVRSPSKAQQGKRYEFCEFGFRSNLSPPKESKIKTYQFKKTDVIVNPQKEKEVGLKIVKKITKSPDKLLTEHPLSDPNLYFFSNQTIKIQKKGYPRDKNKSSICFQVSQEVPSPFAPTPIAKPKKSQKKHFSKYFEENLYSHIS